MTERTLRRLLMTADGVGGVWTYALELIAGLAAADVAVTLFVSGRRLSPAQCRDAAGLANLSLVESDLKLEWMDVADIDATNARLRELEADVRPDLVHVNGYANAAAGFSVPVVSVAHSCVETWWRACRGEPAPAQWDGYRARLREGVAAATCVVAPTAAHLAAFTAAHGVPRRAEVIRNGIDPSPFAAGEKTPVALAVGRFWDEAKNLAVLEEAARHVPIHLVGDVGDAAAAGVTALGVLPRAELATRMAEAAVFVAPAIYEPFGLAVLEAALSGCALVLGDIPTMRELWDGAAVFVDPRDAGVVALAIAALLDDPDEVRRRGSAARRVGLSLTRTAMTQSYLALYRPLAVRSNNERPAAA